MKTFNTRTEIRKHKIDIHGKIKCNLCDFESISQKYLKCHMKNNHKNQLLNDKNLIATNITNEFNIFYCPTCNYSTSKKLTLENHKKKLNHFDVLLKELNVDIKNNINKCTKCDFAADNKLSLVNHMNSKHNKFMLPCNYPNCKKSFKSDFYLKLHEKKQHEKNDKDVSFIYLLFFN